MGKTNKFNELFCKSEMYTKDEVLEILKEIDSDISNFCRWQNDEGIYVDEVSLHLIIERRIKGMRGEE